MSQVVKHQIYRHLLVGLVAILLIGMLSFVGCRATPTNLPPTQIPLAIPQRVDLLGKVKLAEIIDDEDFAEFYRGMAAQEATLPQTLDAAVDQVEHEIGVNLRDFTNVTVFGDASALLESVESAQGSSGLPYCGALVEGKLDESTFIPSLESKIGQELARSNYQNFTIYALPDSYNQDGAFSMAFLADGQMVIGTSQAVKDVIDVTVRLQEPLSGTVYELYSQLGDALIKLASSVPESLTRQIPAKIPIGPINLSLRSFRDINYATLIITKKEAIINADVHLEFSNKDSAKASGLLLWIAIKAGKYVVPDPNAKELLSKVHTSRSGSSVSLTLALTVSEIERLTSAMFEQAKTPKKEQHAAPR